MTNEQNIIVRIDVFFQTSFSYREGEDEDALII